MIERIIEQRIDQKLYKNRAILLLGPRRVGKTTLLKHFLQKNKDALWLNADEKDVQALFNQPNSSTFRKVFQGKKIVVIDEAQQIKNIGAKLKLITDELKDVQVIISGSSAFELANKVNEPLTGRKWEYKLYPLSFEELSNHYGILEEKRLLNHRLIYGSYPDVVTSNGDEKEVLKELTDSYLYKDILIWNRINKSEALTKLLQALAFQLGHQVSYNELAKIVGVDNQTIESYIQLLEYAFIIFRLGSFNRNLRTELKKSKKIYFYDNGVRNAIIANFQQVELRQDTGALWENYLIAERVKYNAYHNHWTNSFFWRTRSQQEVDYIEEKDGEIQAFEFKWNSKKKHKLTQTFTNAYPNAKTQIITPENYIDFISA
ncbi:MAG: ATP-binding protein [Vicingaceae bacterium]